MSDEAKGFQKAVTMLQGIAAVFVYRVSSRVSIVGHSNK